MFMFMILRFFLSAFNPIRFVRTLIAIPELALPFFSQVSFAIQTIILINTYAPYAEIKLAFYSSIGWGITGLILLIRRYGLSLFRF